MCIGEVDQVTSEQVSGQVDISETQDTSATQGHREREEALSSFITVHYLAHEVLFFIIHTRTHTRTLGLPRVRFPALRIKSLPWCFAGNIHKVPRQRLYQIDMMLLTSTGESKYPHENLVLISWGVSLNFSFILSFFLGLSIFAWRSARNSHSLSSPWITLVAGAREVRECRRENSKARHTDSFLPSLSAGAVGPYPQTSQGLSMLTVNKASIEVVA